MKVSAIIPAAGSGQRFGSKTPKLFFKVENNPVFFYTLKNLARAYPFSEILVATHPDFFKDIQKIADKLKLRAMRLIAGGATRAESVKNALDQASSESEWVLVHDAARPLVSSDIVTRTLKAAKKGGGAIAAIPATATVKRVSGLRIVRTEDRDTLYLAQTPQVFKRVDLLARYRKLGKKALGLTDEAAFFDRTNAKILIAEGDVSNLKITTPGDIDLFRFYLKNKRGMK